MIIYTEDEVKMIIKAFHLDSVKGQYNKDLLEWCNNWLSENLYKNELSIQQSTMQKTDNGA